MGLTSAMLVGFTGIKSNQVAIDAIGDNVANVNTTGFKNQRTLFETEFYRTMSEGSGPGPSLGGTNPRQTGYGSAVASIQRSFVQGSVEPTGVPSDLAIQGDGFFVVNAANGDRVFTRDGAFALNTENALVTSSGDYLQGFAADSSGAIVPGTLNNLTVPIGIESEARASTRVVMDGNLDAGASPATSPAVVTSAALATADGPASADTSLTELVNESGDPLFSEGDIISLDGAQKGGLDLSTAGFTVGTDGSTLGDFADFLESALGIQEDPEGTGAGVIVGDGTTGPEGSLVITSNLGQVNAVSLDSSSIRNSTAGNLMTTFSSTPADGQGTTTSFLVYDSLGSSVEVRLRTVMESVGETGSVWRYYAESPNELGTGSLLGSGTINFDQNGQFVAATGTGLTIDRSASGAAPIGIELDLSQVNGLADPEGESILIMSTQDGSPAGNMVAYGIDQNGIIEGVFSNGNTRVLGQVALATFANPQGLVATTGSNYVTGPNSGEPEILAPNSLGAGRIEAGSLEASNVDLSREFVGLITASTGFSAASRVVRTADELLQELLLLAR